MLGFPDGGVIVFKGRNPLNASQRFIINCGNNMNQEFEKFLYIRKGLQPITVQGYHNAIRYLSKKITINKEQAENYVYNLYKSSYSYSHKANQVKALEYWFEFNNQPLTFARQRKPKPIIKQTLTEAEITRLIFVCKNIRERAIVAVLAYSGIRPKELKNLHLRDFDFGSNELRIIQGKGLKDGIIYISSSCVKIILEYLTKYPKQSDDLLFLTADGLREFNQNCLRKLIKVLTIRAGLVKRIYPYLFRHSLATSMINRGADIMTVKKQLRHSLIETTLLYISSLGYCAKNEYDKYCPSYL